MLSTIYGVGPGLSISHDGDVEMPCPEAIWQAPTEEDWRRLGASNYAGYGLTIRESINMLVKGGHDFEDSLIRWSGFSVVLILHLLAIHMA
jgi:hypothetical protein